MKKYTFYTSGFSRLHLYLLLFLLTLSVLFYGLSYVVPQSHEALLEQVRSMLQSGAAIVLGLIGLSLCYRFVRNLKGAGRSEKVLKDRKGDDQHIATEEKFKIQTYEIKHLLREINAHKSELCFYQDQITKRIEMNVKENRPLERLEQRKNSLSEAIAILTHYKKRLYEHLELIEVKKWKIGLNPYIQAFLAGDIKKEFLYTLRNYIEAGATQKDAAYSKKVIAEWQKSISLAKDLDEQLVIASSDNALKRIKPIEMDKKVDEQTAKIHYFAEDEAFTEIAREVDDIKTDLAHITAEFEFDALKELKDELE
ncbi:hypothetical protein ACFL27_08510 [candidate division CSSED10-310 bacterium]|uniref:Uncharacterized protein n=1 Tax=candidate division CSSED10-310 bacterium TaxID=2855610 RepID=A0ABV6YVL5_UNCC1